MGLVDQIGTHSLSLACLAVIPAPGRTASTWKYRHTFLRSVALPGGLIAWLSWLSETDGRAQAPLQVASAWSCHLTFTAKGGAWRGWIGLRARMSERTR